MTEKSKQNARKLGKDTLLWQIQEECAELIQAVAKYNRCRGVGQITEVSKKRPHRILQKNWLMLRFVWNNKIAGGTVND